MQYLSDCPNLSVVLDHLEDAGVDRRAIQLHEISEDGPIPSGFAGSPTVLIDGINPLGTASTETSASCTLRIPSVDLLRKFLDRN